MARKHHDDSDTLDVKVEKGSRTLEHPQYPDEDTLKPPIPQAAPRHVGAGLAVPNAKEGMKYYWSRPEMVGRHLAQGYSFAKPADHYGDNAEGMKNEAGQIQVNELILLEKEDEQSAWKKKSEESGE